jgi:hypothetical protein
LTLEAPLTVNTGGSLTINGTVDQGTVSGGSIVLGTGRTAALNFVTADVILNDITFGGKVTLDAGTGETIFDGLITFSNAADITVASGKTIELVKDADVRFDGGASTITRASAIEFSTEAEETSKIVVGLGSTLQINSETALQPGDYEVDADGDVTALVE